MQMVVLAAGHGRRFGGLKQLAAVTPDGETIMDLNARDACAAGIDGVVLVVREEVRHELLTHVEAHWPSELAVVPVVQGPVSGTAQAVASARAALTGPFGVANADDLYGAGALEALAGGLAHLEAGEHLLISYCLRDTVLTEATVTRGVCEVDASGQLERIVELSVASKESGGFVGVPIAGGKDRSLTGDEPVSMNLWGFSPSMLDECDDALARFDPSTAPHAPGKAPEVLLPEVVGHAVTDLRARVRVVPSNSRCIGITHPDDLQLVRSLVATR